MPRSSGTGSCSRSAQPDTGSPEAHANTPTRRYTQAKAQHFMKQLFRGHAACFLTLPTENSEAPRALLTCPTENSEEPKKNQQAPVPVDLPTRPHAHGQGVSWTYSRAGISPRNSRRAAASRFPTARYPSVVPEGEFQIVSRQTATVCAFPCIATQFALMWRHNGW